MQNSIKFSVAVSGLLAQIPPDKVVWRTMSGNTTAAQMQALLDVQDDAALQWVTSFARFTRDVFTQRALLNLPASQAEPSSLGLARTVQVKAFSTLMKEPFVGADVIFWTPATGGVTRDQMLAELDSGGDVSVQYIGCYIQQMHDMLNDTRD